jgi:hypothetical protein
MVPSTVTADTFARAVAALRTARPRHEISVREAPAPQRIAPFAFALAGAVRAGPERPGPERPGPGAAGPDGTPPEAATGRLILLYDPAGHPAWRGRMRLVTYVTVDVEPDLAGDALLAEVAWSWLVEALENHRAGHTALAGTVTRTSSTRFGELAGPAPAAAVEIRASWSPTVATGDLGTHVQAWCGLLASAAGLPPPGVTTLRP